MIINVMCLRYMQYNHQIIFAASGLKSYLSLYSEFVFCIWWSYFNFMNIECIMIIPNLNKHFYGTDGNLQSLLYAESFKKIVQLMY